ncbi:KilA-N domain-containing protein [Sulfurimonas sp. SAG-AH-194-C20]|nr:KilA-N domain-containing protein [Sulfurimonas sp. SAG-AH-194-C20]MDF1879484.1 KilA-N domain-containing protein [Sulfurimonas sp. SAG-AH-194-C20]
MAKIKVLDSDITVIKVNNEDFISLTDMLKSKDGDFFISDWLRNRNTIEYLGIWEKIHNQDFNYGEYAIITSKSGLNNYKLSVKEWKELNPKLKGNMRDYADVNQLVCLANLESLNAHFIDENITQSKRVEKLNQVAIKQMNTLLKDKNMKRLGELR